MTEFDIRAQLLATVGGMDRFVSSFNWRAFSPDKRAETAISDGTASAEGGLSVLIAKGATLEQRDQWLAGFVKRWAAYQHAGARTVNWMITGPARFPVARNNKAMEVERKRYDEYALYANGAAYWISRRERSAERAALSETAKGDTFKEELIAGVRCVHNTTLDRLQLLFDGKPSDAIRDSLKGNAFRWSPREGAWQRQLTNNAIAAARRVLAVVKENA